MTNYENSAEEVGNAAIGNVGDETYDYEQRLIHPYFRRPPTPWHPSIVEPDAADCQVARVFWALLALADGHSVSGISHLRTRYFDNPGEWRIAEADVIECLEHGLKSEEAFERGDLAEGFFYLKGFDTDPMAMLLDDAGGKETPGARLH